MHVDGHVATATAVSETGLVLAVPSSTLEPRRIVSIDCVSLDATLGLRHCRGRVVSIARTGGRQLVEVAFVALPEVETHRNRRFTVAR